MVKNSDVRTMVFDCHTTTYGQVLAAVAYSGHRDVIVKMVPGGVDDGTMPDIQPLDDWLRGKKYGKRHNL